MRRKLAHLLRRGARVMIRWSNKLDPPHHDHVHTAMGRTSGAQFAAGINLAAAERRTAEAHRRYEAARFQ